MHDDIFRVRLWVSQPASLATSVLSGSNDRPEVSRLRRPPVEPDGIVHRWSPAFPSRGGYQPDRDISVGNGIGASQLLKPGPPECDSIALANAPCAIGASDHLRPNRFGDEHSVGIGSVCAIAFLGGRLALSELISRKANP